MKLHDLALTCALLALPAVVVHGAEPGSDNAALLSAPLLRGRPTATADDDGATVAGAGVAQLFVGAQHWNESGWYADKGFKQHYDGYFCLCECHDSVEGVFCSGAGVQPDGQTKVASFLGVFNGDDAGGWAGDLVAFDTKTPFADHFSMRTPGGRSNYTGVSQALGGASFVWRGYMSGVDCQFKAKCQTMCSGVQQFQTWFSNCG